MALYAVDHAPYGTWFFRLIGGAKGESVVRLDHARKQVDMTSSHGPSIVLRQFLHIGRRRFAQVHLGGAANDRLVPTMLAVHLSDPYSRVSPTPASPTPWQPLAGLRRIAQRCGKRTPHALVADGRGVWAWNPRDAAVPASHTASLQRWVDVHPGADVCLWSSGDFDTREAASVAARGGVRFRTLAPWWQHTFVEAMHCAHWLQRAPRGVVCVVEGRHVSMVTTTKGRATGLHQTVLHRAEVGLLSAELQRMLAGDEATEAVVVGHGLDDGAVARHLPAVVLGRLDGQQPPQWLRPH